MVDSGLQVTFDPLFDSKAVRDLQIFIQSKGQVRPGLLIDALFLFSFLF